MIVSFTSGGFFVFVCREGNSEIACVQNVQHFALKVCLHQWNSIYSDCLHAVHLPSLSARYALAKLTLLYKIKNSLVFFPSGYIHPAHVSAYALRHQHSSNIFIPFFRTESGLNSFLPSAAALWNSLPSHIQDLNSLFSFKSAVKSTFF